jgi:SAM-dependent methyltransferase
MPSPYAHPLYYEIAFSFFDVKKQCDLIERFIAKYSKIDVRRCLDIACGPSLQLREFARRGYESIGMDSSAPMLRYLQARATESGLSIQTIKADMCDFRLPKKVDFAFIMMGSISLIESNARFLKHLDSVARCLRKGGLYLIENAEADWAKPGFFGSQTWVVERDGIRVETSYDLKLRDTLAQTAVATITFDVNDHGQELMFADSREVKIIFPQEYLALIEMNGKFEFIGWFEHNSMRKLKPAKENNMAILRRK